MNGSDPVLFSGASAARIMRGTLDTEQMKRSGTGQRRRGGGGPTMPIRGRITGSEVASGSGLTTVWKYSGEQTSQSAPGAGNLAAVSGGWTCTLTAYNDEEEINPDATGTTHAVGIGAFPDDLNDGTTPTLGPVPTGTPVWFHPWVCTNGSLIYRFSGRNTLTQACDEE